MRQDRARYDASACWFESLAAMSEIRFLINATVTGQLLVPALILIALCILLIVSYWKIYEKMGLRGWLSLIPFYGFYVFCKKLGLKKLFWINLAVNCAETVFSILTYKDNLPQNDPSLYLAVEIIYWLAMLIIDFVLMYKLSEEFGHGLGFTFGLVLLPVIFYAILGLGDSKYLGYADEDYHGNSE